MPGIPVHRARHLGRSATVIGRRSNTGASLSDARGRGGNFRRGSPGHQGGGGGTRAASGTIGFEASIKSHRPTPTKYTAAYVPKQARIFCPWLRSEVMTMPVKKIPDTAPTRLPNMFIVPDTVAAYCRPMS